MENAQDKYEVVIGLEVHAQLSTESKLFCGDGASFGADPNTHISPITLGYPGTLPFTNKKAVNFAVRLGLACDCKIAPYTYFARKNYFYPDLPKGYQISQNVDPICQGGIVRIKTDEGYRNVQLDHIHLEDDAGKSIHDIDPNFTCVDYNRAGVPLVEIVSMPDMHSAEEAFQYVTELRRLVRWIDICDGNMEEGSMRCDANVSIRLKGETKLGTKAEVKNINSIRNVKKAIEYEVSRMIEMAEKGEPIIQQTRSFDAATDTTFVLREKENANDYRYFPEPDLAPIQLTEAYVEKVKAALPALPYELFEHYQSELGLSEYDASVLCADKNVADYFQSAISHSKNYKSIANWINGPLRQMVNENGGSFDSLSLSGERLAQIIDLVDSNALSFSVAASKLLPIVLSDSATSPAELAKNNNLLQSNDADELATWIDQVIASMPDKVDAYRKGKKGLIGMFVGQVKKVSKGKADPKLTMELLEEKLK